MTTTRVPPSQQQTTTKKRRRRRNPFAIALADAERKLTAAIKTEKTAERTLFEARAEIPRLRDIIRSLGDKAEALPVPNIPGVVPIVAVAPGEIPEGAGSIPAPVEGAPQPAQAPDIDTLPGMEEDFR
jgi:hypothetical protein